IKYLQQVLRSQPDTFLDELRDKLFTNFQSYSEHDLSVNISTIYRMVRREGFTWKKLTKIATERKRLQCAEFQLRMSKYQAEQLLLVDETSKDDRTTFRHHGFA
ncbi:hypothetical protein C7212DRAFT_103478, partial [Tuber magnatum]